MALVTRGICWPPVLRTCSGLSQEPCNLPQTEEDTAAVRKASHPGSNPPSHCISDLCHTTHPAGGLEPRWAWCGGWAPRAQAPGCSAFPCARFRPEHIMKADITSNTIRSFG